jgi:hypothetical protein
MEKHGEIKIGETPCEKTGKPSEVIVEGVPLTADALDSIGAARVKSASLMQSGSEVLEQKIEQKE